MLTVAQPYFESDDFRGDVILHAAFPHPLLKRLIRFERGPDSLMRTNDRADALSRYNERVNPAFSRRASFLETCSVCPLLAFHRCGYAQSGQWQCGSRRCTARNYRYKNESSGESVCVRSYVAKTRPRAF